MAAQELRCLAMPGARRDEALVLSEEILSDIELNRLAPVDVARKTSRLARLLDDVDGLEWLDYEIVGYPTPITEPAIAAADRSGRLAEITDEGPRYWLGSLGELVADVEGARAALAALSGEAATG